MRKKRVAVDKDEEGFGELKTALILDAEIRCLEFAHLFFWIASGITVKRQHASQKTL